MNYSRTVAYNCTISLQKKGALLKKYFFILATLILAAHLIKSKEPTPAEIVAAREKTLIDDYQEEYEYMISGYYSTSETIERLEDLIEDVDEVRSDAQTFYARSRAALLYITIKAKILELIQENEVEHD